MYQFYIKGASAFPVELTDEQTAAGKIITLLNGNLLQVKVSEGLVTMTVLSGTNGVAIGVVYGVSHDGEWIDGTTKISQGTRNPAGATGNWVAGLTEKEAINHANGPLALIIGTPGEFVEVSFKMYASIPVINCSLRVEPGTITAERGELVSFYVYDGLGDAISQSWQVDAGAKIITEGHAKLIVGADQAGSLVRIKMTREYKDGRICEGEALLTIKEDATSTQPESPAPVEPAEPVNLDADPIDFKEAIEVERKESNTEPGFRISTHRMRGIRESEKLSEYFLGSHFDIDNLTKDSEALENTLRNRKNAYRKGEGSLDPLTVQKSGQWTIEKRPYQGFVRMPFFGCVGIVSQEIKFNGKLIEISDGRLEDYGILVLTGQALQLGGKLEVKATWKEEIDRGSHVGSEELMKQSSDILREVHRIIGGE